MGPCALVNNLNLAAKIKSSRRKAPVIYIYMYIYIQAHSARAVHVLSSTRPLDESGEGERYRGGER